MRRLVHLVWLLLPAATLFGGAELLLRARLSHEWPWGITRADDELGWSLNPGWSGRFHGVEVRISNAGLRDPRSLDELRALERSTLVLGDSVVMGYGVPEEDTVPRRLEAVLGGPVVNAGVIGFGTEQEAMLLARLDGALGAERIVLGMCLNDIASQEQYRVRIAPRGDAARLSEALRERSALVHWMRKRVRRLMVRSGAVEDERTGDLDLGVLAGRLAEDPAGTMAGARRGLESLAVIARGRPVLAAVFPYRQQLAEGADLSPQRALLQAAGEAGVPALDVLPALRESGRPDLYVDNCHLSRTGAEVAARAIGERLLHLSAPRITPESGPRP